MRIFLTNDDGIQSHGIRILAESLSKLGEIYVVAPAVNHSGAGHGLTVTMPLRAKELESTNPNVYFWAVEGTPADCVKLGMEQLVPAKPDIVVSGINNGPNLATDVIYSGTVAGAMEGFFHGCPAIAVSVTNRSQWNSGNYQLAADVTADYCQKFVSGQIPKALLNINVPGKTQDEVKGLRNVPLGWRWYTDSYDKRIDPAGQTYYWLQGDIVDREADGNTDVEASAEGYITVTPLHYDMTDYCLLASLR